MAGQRDLASKRLEQLIEFELRHREPDSQYFEPWQATAFALELEAGNVPIWDNPKERAVAADIALTLTPETWNDPIRKAFAIFDLDPRNPFHWRKLLWYLADAFFGQRKRGAPKQWNDDRLCKLLSDFYNQKRLDPDLSELVICQRIKTRVHGRYKGIDAPTIRRNLQYARDPQRNLVLGSCYNAYLAMLKRDASAERHEALPAKLVKKLESDALAGAIDQISHPRRKAPSKKPLSEQLGG